MSLSSERDARRARYRLPATFGVLGVTAGSVTAALLRWEVALVLALSAASGSAFLVAAAVSQRLLSSWLQGRTPGPFVRVALGVATAVVAHAGTACLLVGALLVSGGDAQHDFWDKLPPAFVVFLLFAWSLLPGLVTFPVAGVLMHRYCVASSKVDP